MPLCRQSYKGHQMYWLPQKTRAGNRCGSYPLRSQNWRCRARYSTAQSIKSAQHFINRHRDHDPYDRAAPARRYGTKMLDKRKRNRVRSNGKTVQHSITTSWIYVDPRRTVVANRTLDLNTFYLISANRRRSLCVARQSVLLTVFSLVLRMEATVCSLRPS